MIPYSSEENGVYVLELVFSLLDINCFLQVAGIEVGSKTIILDSKNWWPCNSPLTTYTGNCQFEDQTKFQIVKDNAYLQNLCSKKTDTASLQKVVAKNWRLKYRIFRLHHFATYFFSRFSGGTFATCYC